MAGIQHLSEWFRGRRDRLLCEVIARTPRKGERLRILDLGGRGAYWKRLGMDFLRAQKVSIDVLNLTTLELYAEDEGADLCNYVIGNACDLDYADMSYDLCHANSVIEHVGLWPDMQAFAREVRRVAPAYYIQTPNFWFPVDPHFWRMPMQHWLPRPARAQLMRRLPLATSGRAPTMARAYDYVDGTRMLSRRQMALLFPDARLHAERVAGLAKSYTAVREAR